jgi:hypothetical protein
MKPKRDRVSFVSHWDLDDIEVAPGHCQTKFYTAYFHTATLQSFTVFAHESSSRSARIRGRKPPILICLDNARARVGAQGQFDCGTNGLALRTPLTHNPRMAEEHVFTINVARDVQRPDRYRWSVSENMRLRDKSLYSFATKREAQADADKFVQRLNSVWRPRQGGVSK